MARFGGGIWYIHRAHVCSGSELSMADPAWVTIWTSDQVDAPPEGVASYVVSGLTLKVQPEVPSDAVVVEYHLDWSADRVTHERGCITTVFDVSGAVLARRTVTEHVRVGTDSGSLMVVDGEPATASVTRDP